MAGATISEKIVSRAMGRKARAGDLIEALPVDKLYFNEVIGPLVDTPMEITEDRLVEIKMALDDHDQARRHYLDALRIAGRTPWAHL